MTIMTIQASMEYRKVNRLREVRFVVTKDIIIPKGTILTQAPKRIEYSRDHFEAIIGLSNNSAGSFIYCLDEMALRELDYFMQILPDEEPVLFEESKTCLTCMHKDQIFYVSSEFLHACAHGKCAIGVSPAPPKSKERFLYFDKCDKHEEAPFGEENDEDAVSASDKARRILKSKPEMPDLIDLWDTHEWDWANEIPVCIKCGRTPIELGFWGDKSWIETHTDYLTVCVGSKNAVSPQPTHPAGATDKGNLPPSDGDRPGSTPKCSDRSLYGPDCKDCILEFACEEEERSIHEEFMDAQFPDGHDPTQVIEINEDFPHGALFPDMPGADDQIEE